MTERGGAIDTDANQAIEPAGEDDAALGPSRPSGGRGGRGLLGDVRYLARGGLALVRARRERDQLEARLSATRVRREQAVVALAAQAVATTSLDLPPVDDARAELAILEHDHGDHAEARRAIDAAVFTLRREHEEHGRARLDEITTHERRLAELTTSEAPLERELARLDRALAELAAELERLDAANLKLELARARRPLGDRAALDAELATGQANRAMVARDRPALEAERAALIPRLDEVEAARAEAQAHLDAARTAFRTRAAHLDAELRRLAARRETLDRAGADVRGARQARLAALGEQLVLERPAALRRPLAELDELDVAIATDQRRLLDVDEQIDGADRRAMLRGVAVLLLALAAALIAAWVFL